MKGKDTPTSERVRDRVTVSGNMRVTVGASERNCESESDE